MWHTVRSCDVQYGVMWHTEVMWHTVRSCDVQYEVMWHTEVMWCPVWGHVTHCEVMWCPVWGHVTLRCQVWSHLTCWDCLTVCHIGDIVWGNIVWYKLMQWWFDCSHLSRPVSCLPAVQTAPGESQEPQDDLQAVPWHTCKRFTHTLLYRTIQYCAYSVEVFFLATAFAIWKDSCTKRRCLQRASTNPLDKVTWLHSVQEI